MNDQTTTAPPPAASPIHVAAELDAHFAAVSPTIAAAPRERTDVELLAVRAYVAPHLQALIDTACDSGLLTAERAAEVAASRRRANAAIDQLEAPLITLIEAHRQVSLSPYGAQHTLTLTLHGPLALAALRRWAADQGLQVVREVLRHPSGEELVECPCYSVEYSRGVSVDVHNRAEERVVDPTTGAAL